jgi:hypothetical protein
MRIERTFVLRRTIWASRGPATAWRTASSLPETNIMARSIPVEIHEILETYRETARREPATGDAEARALAQLDAVAIKIDPEQDQAFETLLEAARAQVRARAI